MEAVLFNEIVAVEDVASELELLVWAVGEANIVVSEMEPEKLPELGGVVEGLPVSEATSVVGILAVTFLSQSGSRTKIAE